MEVRLFIKRLRHNKTKKINRSLSGNFAIFLILGIMGIGMAFPLVFAISQAFKPMDELFVFPPVWYVKHPTFNNFYDLFNVISNSWVPITRYFLNSVFITVVGTIGHILLASAAAYAFAKHKFPGRNFIFNTIVLSLMFAGGVTAIPSYLIMSKLRWVNTYSAIIVPAFQASLGLYLMKQFMENFVPDAILEAARIDGLNEFGVYFKIAMPMVKPAWLTLMILSIQNLWNATGGVYIYSEELKTFPVALHQIISGGGVARAGVGAAVTVIMMIVPISVFVINQSKMIETMSSSGMKD